MRMRMWVWMRMRLGMGNGNRERDVNVNGNNGDGEWMGREGNRRLKVLTAAGSVSCRGRVHGVDDQYSNMSLGLVRQEWTNDEE